MASPVITYNSKTITLPLKEFDLIVRPSVTRRSNTTLTGAVETLRAPRMDIKVSANFRLIQDAAVRSQLQNWWQWAVRGGAWVLSLDSARTVNTTLSGAEAAGQTVLSVTSTTGISTGQYYKIIDGPNYMTVRVDSIGAGTVTVSSAIDVAMGSGAIFRDEYYFPGVIRDDNAECPIRDVESGKYNPFPLTRFEFTPEFYEAVA